MLLPDAEPDAEPELTALLEELPHPLDVDDLADDGALEELELLEELPQLLVLREGLELLELREELLKEELLLLELLELLKPPLASTVPMQRIAQANTFKIFLIFMW